MPSHVENLQDIGFFLAIASAVTTVLCGVPASLREHTLTPFMIAVAIAIPIGLTIGTLVGRALAKRSGRVELAETFQ